MLYLQYMMNIDQIDENILHELERDGRMSNLDLAQKVGLSPSACSRRVQELERTGVIKGYKAIINRDVLDRGFVVYVAVGLSRHLKQDQEAFDLAMEAASAVTECYNVSGTFEYLLRVEVKDLKAYRSFHTDILGVVPQVSSIISYIVFDSAEDN